MYSTLHLLCTALHHRGLGVAVKRRVPIVPISGHDDCPLAVWFDAEESGWIELVRKARA